MKRIIKKDRVLVISGRYKGSIGVVLQVLNKSNRVVVEGVNKAKKSVKNSGKENYQEKELPIHVSNVALLGPKGETPIKVGYKINKKGIKVRVNRKTGEEIESSK